MVPSVMILGRRGAVYGERFLATCVLAMMQGQRVSTLFLSISRLSVNMVNPTTQSPHAGKLLA
jgi:hypothetical protein